MQLPEQHCAAAPTDNTLPLSCFCSTRCSDPVYVYLFQSVVEKEVTLLNWKVPVHAHKLEYRHVMYLPYCLCFYIPTFVQFLLVIVNFCHAQVTLSRQIVNLLPSRLIPWRVLFARHAHYRCYCPRSTRDKFRRFLLGTGRMPHPVGGAMGVTLSHCREN